MEKQDDLSHVPAFVRGAEVSIILRVGMSTAYRKLSQIKKQLGKKEHQFVSFSEFCQTTGITMRDAARPLRKKPN